MFQKKEPHIYNFISLFFTATLCLHCSPTQANGLQLLSQILQIMLHNKANIHQPTIQLAATPSPFGSSPLAAVLLAATLKNTLYGSIIYWKSSQRR